jgi:hypothetical protein
MYPGAVQDLLFDCILWKAEQVGDFSRVYNFLRKSSYLAAPAARFLTPGRSRLVIGPSACWFALHPVTPGPGPLINDSKDAQLRVYKGKLAVKAV